MRAAWAAAAAAWRAVRDAINVSTNWAVLDD